MRAIPRLPVFAAFAFVFAACQPPADWEQGGDEEKSSRKGPPAMTTIEIEAREDGLAYEKGSDKLLTGTVVVPDDGAAAEGKEGRRMSVPYQDGKIHGTRVRYFPSGRVAEERIYENGVPKSSLSYYSSGVKKYEVTMNAADKAEGPYRRWHANGQIQSEGTFNANERFEGEFKEYDEKGNLVGHYMWKDQKIMEILKETDEQKERRLLHYGKVEGE